MKTSLRAALVAAAAVTTLALASAASAANTGSIAVWYTPMAPGNSTSTTIHVKVPQTTDPIAAVQIYTGTNLVNAGGPAGTSIGTVEATAFSRDNNLTLPLTGTVTTDDPAKYTAQSTQCAGVPTSFAVWLMNLSVAGSSLQIPIYVNHTSPTEANIGGYKLSICLPPPDVPVGTPGRSFQGAQLLEAKLTLSKIFTAPTSAGLSKWDALFTPYTPGKGTPNAAGTFEARAFVPLPVLLGLKATYVKKTNTWRLKGSLLEGGQGVGATTIHFARGLSKTKLSTKSSTRTTSGGSFSSAGHLKPKKTTYFQATASVGERDYTEVGCQTPIAPAGCVSATLSPWSAKSVVVRIKR
jgi:hypothetical protein